MATKKTSLKKYQSKRNFSASPEPSGTKQTSKKIKKPIFVVQKHAASHLHFDVRLEIDGVLASWAVPKGISRDPAKKRLAIHTENHPLDYAQFEGVIPAGNYGAGSVMIWDRGTYRNIKEKDGKLIPMDQCLKRGTIEVWLEGKKLHGSYAFIRTKLTGLDKWLLIKMKDPSAKKVITKNTVTRTNQEKVLFPDDGITKGDLINYYEKIAPYMLPYIKNRAVTMHRFPEGIEHEGFYQKDISDYFPSWIKTVQIPKQDGGKNNYVVCNNAKTLLYLANQACITPHIWLSRIDKLNYPDRMIFDLDPGKENAFGLVRKAAQAIRDILTKLKLASFVMTTGSRGIHIIVPLNRQADFDTVRAFAHDIATVIAKNNSKLFTVEHRLTKRHGRLFIDTTRNACAQTGVAPYAVRAKPGAPVATPISWQELENSRLKAHTYTVKNIFKHLKATEDPWKDMGKYKQSLKNARKLLDELMGNPKH